MDILGPYWMTKFMNTHTQHLFRVIIRRIERKKRKLSQTYDTVPQTIKTLHSMEISVLSSGKFLKVKSVTKSDDFFLLQTWPEVKGLAKSKEEVDWLLLGLGFEELASYMSIWEWDLPRAPRPFGRKEYTGDPAGLLKQ